MKKQADVLIRTPHFIFERAYEGNLETLRELRNSEVLRQFMVHKEQVSPEQQLKWFTENNNVNNHYFIARYQDQTIGYCLLKKIDFETGSGEPGIFLVDEERFDSSFGALYTLSFLDICYYYFGIKNFFGNVRASNSRALNNYRFFTPVQQKGENADELLLSSGTDFNYEEATAKIRRAIETVFDYKCQIEVETNTGIDSSELIELITVLNAKPLPKG